MRENNYRRVADIAREGNVTRTKATRAIFMMDEAIRRDMTVKGMCDATGLGDATVKRYARQFGIRLADYNPFANQHRKTRSVLLAYTRLKPEN